MILSIVQRDTSSKGDDFPILLRILLIVVLCVIFIPIVYLLLVGIYCRIEDRIYEFQHKVDDREFLSNLDTIEVPQAEMNSLDLLSVETKFYNQDEQETLQPEEKLENEEQKHRPRRRKRGKKRKHSL